MVITRTRTCLTLVCPYLHPYRPSRLVVPLPPLYVPLIPPHDYNLRLSHTPVLTHGPSRRWNSLHSYLSSFLIPPRISGALALL